MYTDMSLKEALNFLVSLAKEKKKEELHGHGKTVGYAWEPLLFHINMLVKIMLYWVYMQINNSLLTRLVFPALTLQKGLYSL